MVTISDRCKALCLIQQEKELLDRDAQTITGQQYLHLAKIAELSKQHERIINKRAALDLAAERI